MNAMPRGALYASAPLGVLAFWGGMWMAGRRYPSLYDWRYMTMSNLIYAERNPGGFQWAWGGLILCALGGLGWTTILARDWPRGVGGRRPVGIGALGLGYVCMVCCALLPEWLLRVPKGHEMLALSAFFCLCFGIVQLTYQAAESRLRPRMRKFSRGPWLYASLLAGFALSPIVLAAVAQAYVTHALPELPWVGMEWRVRDVPVYWSFAFWEWITCVVFSAYTVSLCLATKMIAAASRSTPTPNLV